LNARRAALAAGIVALLVHLPALRGGFVYDDFRFVVDNPALDSLRDPGRFFTDLDTTASPDASTRDIYRPLRTSVYALLGAAFGRVPAPFHLVNIVLHAAAAMLLARLILRAGVAPWGALLSSLAFALHPLTVEAVAWISSLGDLLCAVAGLGSLLFHARERRGPALALLAVALLGKEHAVVLPLLWAAWDQALQPSKLRAGLLRGVVPGLLVVGAFLLWRRHLTGGFAQTVGPFGGSHTAAIFTMLGALGYYAAALLVPGGPTFDAEVAVQEGFGLPSALGLVVFVALLGAALRGRPRVRLGASWCLLALLPVSNVFVPLKIAAADRFFYLSLAGLAFLVAEGIGFLRARGVAGRVVPAVLLLLAALTWVRIGDWHDPRSLNAARMRVNPKSLRGVWAQAAENHKEVLVRLAAGDAAGALPHVQMAGDLYDRFLRNAEPAQRVQVHYEFGRLLQTWGEQEQRSDHEGETVAFYTRALEHFRSAHALHRLDLGRRVEAEVEDTASRIVDLCIQLALPENPELPRLFREGVEAVRFLESFRTGRDESLRGAQLLLALALGLRDANPAKARDLTERALVGFRRSGSPAYPTARCLLELASLADRPPDREGIERAQDLFLAAAREQPGLRPYALVLAARCLRILGAQFGNEEALQRRQLLLDEAEKIAVAARLKREIMEERSR